MATPKRALEIATTAHDGQTDKFGVAYIFHPLRAMARVASWGEEAQMVALLHDVIEDSNDWTLERLREEGFSASVVAGVDAMTKRDDEENDDNGDDGYMRFVARAGQNSLGKIVKIADLEDNMDIRRMPTIGSRDAARLNKYLRAWQFLTQQEAS